MANQQATFGSKKIQAAMEYLMTYGWAILAVVIITIAFFQLGILSGWQFEPKANPGSCMVYRLNGPGTTTNINLEGLCQNQLPEFVMRGFGVGDFVQVLGSSTTASRLNIQGNQITITAWVYILGSPFHDIVDKENQYGMKLDYNNLPHSCTQGNNPGLCLEWDTAGSWIGESFPIPNGGFDKWMFLAVEENGSNKYWFANGALIGSATGGVPLTHASSNLSIGAISPGYSGYGEAEWFNGSISNVQIYNASLSPSEIRQMYTNGIGAPPQSLANLEGWWPLNGNANDYSGNLDNGKIYNNSYSGAWNNNYVVP